MRTQISDYELITFFNNLKEIIQAQKELNHVLAKRINLCNSAQEYFPNKQDAEKNKARLYWKGKNENTNKRL